MRNLGLFGTLRDDWQSRANLALFFAPLIHLTGGERQFRHFQPFLAVQATDCTKRRGDLPG